MNKIALFPLNNKRPVHFFERLRQLREVRGHTQLDLAKRSGLHQSAIAHFESGSRLPSFENLRLLSVALSCTADYLLGIAPSPAQSFEDPAFNSFHKLSGCDREVIALMIDALILRAANTQSQLEEAEQSGADEVDAET